jgi:hypothetical protein
MRILGIVASSILKRITDTFNRTTSGSLGTASSGALWEAIRGTWFSNGTQAQSNGTASDYPIAVVNLGQFDATTSASISSGTGVAFWVSDANSWWSSTSFNTSTDTPYSYSYACGTYSSFTFQASWLCNGVATASGGSYSTAYIGSCGALLSSISPGCSYNIGNFSCSGSVGTSTDYCTASGVNTSYNYYLRLSKSVAGTVTPNVVSDVSLASQPAAIKVITSGNLITAQAYSNTALTAPMGSSISTTQSSPTKGGKVGIIKAPTSYDQQSTVDDFSATGA